MPFLLKRLEIDKKELEITKLKESKDSVLKELENFEDGKLIEIRAEIEKLKAEIEWLERNINPLVLASGDSFEIMLKQNIDKNYAKLKELIVEKIKLEKESKLNKNNENEI